jgi:hypothetical protein
VTFTTIASALFVVTFVPSVASAARGHVFAKTFGEPCKAGEVPCGPGKLSNPTGVAVNESKGEPQSGDVYVVDQGDARVEYFNSTGLFQGEFSGPSASGEGMVIPETQTIEFATTTGAGGSGAFSVGEQIEGKGIPANTEITGIPASGTLEISNPIEMGGIPETVKLKAHQSFVTPVGEVFGQGPDNISIAVDNDPGSPSFGDVYVADVVHQVIDKFSSTGAYLGQLNLKPEEGSNLIDGVAVDPSGVVWVADRTGSVFEFSNAEVNEPLSPTSASTEGCFNLPGLAVDSEDDPYVDAECAGIVKFNPEGMLLNGAFDQEGSDGLAVELATSDVYVDQGTSLARIGSEGLVEGLPIESLPLVGGAGSGVAVSSASETLYVTESVAGDVEVFTLEPAGPPTVEKESVSKVTGDSATLEAVVNPRSKPGEPATEYRFEYITGAAYRANLGAGLAAFAGAVRVGGHEFSPGSLPAEFNVDAVAPVNVQELLPGTTYHYRVLAENAKSRAAGKPTEGQLGEKGEEVVHTFTTQVTQPPGGAGGLLDRREWELVSPADKHGALLESIGDEVTIQASAAGGAMTYTANAPTESATQGFSGPVQVFSTRSSTGWSSRDMTLPHESATRTSIGKGAQYRLFSEDLSHAVVQPFGTFVACRSPEGATQPCLSPEASEQTAFLQTDFLGGDPGEACRAQTMACFQPLVTGAAGVSNVPSGTRFGDESACAPPAPLNVYCGPEFLAATPDLKHVVLHSGSGLTSPSSGGLYEFSQEDPPAQQLAPIDLLPEAEGGGATLGELGYHGRNTRNAISADGSLVFFQTETGAGGGAEGPLYVRHISSGVTGQTLRLTAGEGIFQDASSNGSRVFYSEGGTLFECAISEVAGELKCPATEIGGGLTGLVLGASEDGSRLYFVASSALATGAVSGQPNLYVRHEATTSLVAVLSSADFPDWSGANVGDLTAMTARVSPNGQWLAFMSRRELTGYDNRDALSGNSDEEVFLYDAGSGSDPPELMCASCNPSGARPVGEEAAQASPGHGGFVVREAWEGPAWLAAEVPAWTPYRLLGAVYQSRFLSNSGRLFFNAIDPLVTHAVNGNWDVYEFEPPEPPGVGSCEVGGAAFSDRTGGCVGLISGGDSPRESAFLDASENGNDAFFLTAAKLVPRDTDEAFDVYDAHVCTSAEPCLQPEATQPPACETEASCRPAPTPQPKVFGAPSSATFSGSSNPPPPPTPAVVKPKSLTRAQRLAAALKSCKKDKKRSSRVACEKLAKKKYAVAKKASKKKSR